MADNATGNWWSRNWKRAVPLGCLALMMLAVGLVAAIMWLIKSTAPYDEALTSARAHCAVVEALGTPIDAGWFVSGSVEVSGPSGNADMSFPVEGSRASGRLYVVAHKQAGRWEFGLLQLEMEGQGARIDLLAPRDEECALQTVEDPKPKPM